MTERHFNLVVPLPHEGTDMRTTDTAGSAPGRSGAVSRLNARPGDVDSTTGPATPGIRTSTTATRTTTTRTTSSALVPSADWSAHAEPTFAELAQAYFDCRRTKRNTASALAFEQDLEHNLRQLYDELIDGSYTPGRSICFAITRPKPREVWAAAFRDRIVHHLLHNRIAPRFYARFIADSCACIPGQAILNFLGPRGWLPSSAIAKGVGESIRSVASRLTAMRGQREVESKTEIINSREVVLFRALVRETCNKMPGVGAQARTRPEEDHTVEPEELTIYLTGRLIHNGSHRKHPLPSSRGQGALRQQRGAASSANWI